MLILREYYTVAWRYNYYFQVEKITFCKREQGVKYFHHKKIKLIQSVFAHTHKKKTLKARN